ncbi:MAG: penicillin acylase family protein [Proteobacteria bacterium]|nr:penicillin acylase family protein [Pseudomonadota bacterium]
MERLDPSVRRILDAYARGVNARLARIEAGAVGAPVAMHGWPEPAPWTPGDSLALLKLTSWVTGASLDIPLVLDDLIERLTGLAARPFFPAESGIQAVNVPVDLSAFSGAPRAGAGPALASRGPARGRGIGDAFLGGSAWVLAGERTAGGSPLLAAELHAAPTAPALVYEIALEAGAEDWRVAGATIPGIPVVWAGRNADVAWAATPGGAVIADLYEETLRRDDPSRYHNGGRWVPLTERVEAIRVRTPRGAVREESLAVRSTHHGPLVNALLEEERKPMALAWTGAWPGDGIGSLLALTRARDAEAVVEAMRGHHEPVIALVYADRFGAGGVQVAGWIPRRMLPTSLMPVPGRMRAFTWHEPVPFEALPARQLGPGRTWVVAADGRWGASPPGQRIEWLWRSGVRARRLDELVAALAGLGRADLAGAAAIQNDRGVATAADIVPALFQLAGEAGDFGPEVREVAALLRGWDGRAAPESAAAAVYHVLIHQLVRELFAEALGESMLARYQTFSRGGADRVAEAIVMAAARGGARGAWSDPDRVRAAVRRSLHQTWASLSYRLGPNRGGWSWGRVHQLRFTPVPASRADERGPAAALGPIGTGGDGATLFLAEYDAAHPFDVRLASVFRMAADLSAPDGLWTELAPGQSEHPNHPHYADRTPSWLDASAAAAAKQEPAEAGEMDDDLAVERLILEPAPAPLD